MKDAERKEAREVVRDRHAPKKIVSHKILLFFLNKRQTVFLEHIQIGVHY